MEAMKELELWSDLGEWSSITIQHEQVMGYSVEKLNLAEKRFYD